MLSRSHPKIHEPRLTGVSPPTDQRQRQKTAKHEGQVGLSSHRDDARGIRDFLTNWGTFIYSAPPP